MNPLIKVQTDQISNTRSSRLRLLPLSTVVAGMLMLSIADVSAQSKAQGVVTVKASQRDSIAPDQEASLMEAERDLLRTLTARISDAPAKKSAPAKPKPVVEAKGAPAAPAAAPNAKPAVPAEAKAMVKPAALPEQHADIERLKQENASLKSALASQKSHISQIEVENDQLRSRLSIAETEARRLGSVMDGKNRSALSKYDLPEVPPARKPDAPPARVPRSAGETSPPSKNQDMPIATVSVDKAELRLGPGSNHSALMSIPKGSRLVVEARQGEWYRVFAPNGERAWVSAKVVIFGEGINALNDGTTARVKGFDAGVEDEAFRLFNKESGVE